MSIHCGGRDARVGSQVVQEHSCGDTSLYHRSPLILVHYDGDVVRGAGLAGCPSWVQDAADTSISMEWWVLSIQTCAYLMLPSLFKVALSNGQQAAAQEGHLLVQDLVQLRHDDVDSRRGVA